MIRTSLIAASLALFGLACEKKPVAPAAPDKVKAVEATPVTPPPAEPAGILLGEVGSLTGSEAAFGISTRNGIELALEEVNAAGGVKGQKVSVRVLDDQSKPEEAASATKRLITQDKVVAILGEVASSNSLAMAPIAQAAQVPMVSPSSTNPKVTEVGDYIFRVCFIDPFQGAVMAKYAHNELKFKRVAILTDKKSAYSEGLTEVFKAKFAEFPQATIAGIEAYAKGDTDFRAQLTNIKKLKVQGLYIPGYYEDVGKIAEQARELGLKVVMMGGDGWDSAKLFELGGTAVEGSYVSNHYSADDPQPRVQDFIKKYQAKFGAVPDSLAALGYDSARVVLDALKRSNGTGPSLRDAIAQTKDFPGVAGTITLDANRNPVKPAVVLKVEGGKFKYVTTIAP